MIIWWVIYWFRSSMIFHRDYPCLSNTLGRLNILCMQLTFVEAINQFVIKMLYQRISSCSHNHIWIFDHKRFEALQIYTEHSSTRFKHSSEIKASDNIVRQYITWRWYNNSGACKILTALLWTFNGILDCTNNEAQSSTLKTC